MIQARAKTKTTPRLSKAIGAHSLVRSCLLVFCCLGLFGCGSGPDEEGGLIGTGIIIGTVSENKVLASESVEVKASSGEKYSITLTRSRRFERELAEGDAPWLLRTNLGNGEYHYAIAYDRTRTNIHSYSDVVLRSWFAANRRDITTEFNNADSLFNLPTKAEFNEASERILSVVELALQDYGVTGPQLFSASFEANDTGIDEYLDKNPIIINDQKIKVVLTDPVSEFQSNTDLSLTASGSVLDTSSPTVVRDVRALGSGLTEMVVLWNPAEDNVGVRGYQVLRDGVLVTTTPYPVYTDTGLQPGGTYSYEVIALDGSGNLAPVSIPGVGQTLSDVDTQAPPTPTLLAQLEGSSVRVVLRWSQSEIQDVVSFNVYRGQPGETVELLIRTTSTDVTDPSVTGGTTYCYRVQAVDGSGNVSGLSEQLCLSTDGSVVAPGGGDDSMTAGLNIPNLNAVSCDATISNSLIVSDLTLTESCYRVTSDITVGQFADLVIPAGTILKFAQGVGITVSETGSLSANGTKQNPVIFTGQEDVAGYWRGIEYNRTYSTDNRIVNSVIEYAGGAGQDVALLVTSSVGERSRLRVDGSLIRFNKGSGFSFAGLGTTIDSFAGNVVTENDRIASIGMLVLASVSSDNNFSGNVRQLIDVPRLGVDVPLLIPDLGVPLRSNGILMEQADVTIEAGVEIQFLSDTFLQIDDGNLLVKGSPERPVLLSGTENSPGFWGGVHLRNSPASSLENVTIEYAGAPVLQANANLTLADSAASLVNVILRNSSAYGYVLDGNSELLRSDGVQLIDNALQ